MRRRADRPVAVDALAAIRHPEIRIADTNATMRVRRQTSFSCLADSTAVASPPSKSGVTVRRIRRSPASRARRSECFPEGKQRVVAAVVARGWFPVRPGETKPAPSIACRRKRRPASHPAFHAPARVRCWPSRSGAEARRRHRPHALADARRVACKPVQPPQPRWLQCIKDAAAGRRLPLAAIVTDASITAPEIKR